MTDKKLKKFACPIHIPIDVARAIRVRKATTEVSMHKWIADIVTKELEREGYLEVKDE